MYLFKTKNLVGAGLSLTLSLGLSLGAAFLQNPLSPAQAQGSKEEAAALVTRAVESMQKGKNSEALPLLEQAVKLDPRLPSAYNNIGRIYADRGESDKAVTFFKKAINIEPLYEPALSNLGLVQYSRGKPEDAIHPWRLCLSGQGKNDATIHYYLANALRDAGNKAEKADKESLWREARERYNTAIKLNPQFAAAYSGLSVVDLNEGRLDDAYNSVLKSIKLKGDSSFSYYHLGLIEERRGRIQEAVKAFEKSAKYEKDPRYKEDTRRHIAQLTGGAVPTTSGNTQPTNNQAGYSPDNNVNQNELMKAKGQAALKKHAYGEAVEAYDYLVRNGLGEDPVILNNYGYALAGAGQTNKAIDAYQKAVALKPGGFMEAQYNLGMAYRRAKNNEAAEQAFRRSIQDAAKAKKTNAVAQNMLGILLKEQERYEEASNAFKKAIMQSGNDLPVAHFNQALLLERMERSKEAVSEYKTYLKLSPKGKNAAAARERYKRLTGTNYM